MKKRRAPHLRECDDHVLLLEVRTRTEQRAHDADGLVPVNVPPDSLLLFEFSLVRALRATFPGQRDETAIGEPTPRHERDLVPEFGSLLAKHLLRLILFFFSLGQPLQWITSFARFMGGGRKDKVLSFFLSFWACLIMEKYKKKCSEAQTGVCERERGGRIERAGRGHTVGGGT